MSVFSSVQLCSYWGNLLLLLHLHHLQRIHPRKRHGHPRQSWHATKRHPRLWDAHLRRHLLRNLCVWVRRQLRHSRYCRGRPAIGMGRRSYARRRWSYPSRPRLLLLAGVSCDAASSASATPSMPTISKSNVSLPSFALGTRLISSLCTYRQCVFSAVAVVSFLWHVGHWKCFVRWCWIRTVSSSNVLSEPQYQLHSPKSRRDREVEGGRAERLSEQASERE